MSNQKPKNEGQLNIELDDKTEMDEEWDQMDEDAFANYADSLEEDLYESKKSIKPKEVHHREILKNHYEEIIAIVWIKGVVFSMF